MATDEQKKFQIGESLSFGWTNLKTNFLPVSVFVIITMLISMAPNIITMSDPESPMLSLISAVVSIILGVFVQIIIYKSGLLFIDKGAISIGEITPEFSKFVNLLLGSLLYGLIVFGGLILLIIPGIIFALKYGFYGYLIVDQNLGPLEAIKKSGEITKGSKFDLFIFALLSGVIIFAGLVAFIIGIIPAAGIIYVAWASIYRKLILQETHNTVRA